MACLALQGPQLAALERAWRERNRGVATASAAVAASGLANIAALGGTLPGSQLPRESRGPHSGQLDTIPEEAVGSPEHRSASNCADPVVHAVAGSQQLTEPGQHNVKRRKVSKRPLLGGSLLEGL
jgi:hypothetical protein